MKIAIIGSGNIGGTLARGLDKKGHKIIIGTRNTANNNVMNLVQHGQHITSDTISNAVRQAEIVIIAVPFTKIPDLVPVLGDLTGKIIIETSNAFGKLLPSHGSGNLAIKALSGNVDVVKAFNTIGAEDLANPTFGSLKADTFVAGESKKAKAIAMQLAKDMDFENCFDLGGDDAIPLLESLAMIWGALAFKTGLGRRCALKVLHD
jgi:predicted dinucleotide-binding enzyme